VALETPKYRFMMDGSVQDREAPEQDTISGYPVTGSIATFTPDRKPQFERFLPDVMRKYPLQEVGTGRLKYHVQKDGSKITYCGTSRPDAEGNVAACANNPYGHEIVGLPNTCKRRGCPECYPHWSGKAAKRVSQTINGYLLATVPETLKTALKDALAGLSKGNTSPDEWKQLAEIQGVLDRASSHLARHIVISPPREAIVDIVQRTESALVKRGIDIEKNSIRYRNEFHRVFMKKYRRKLDRIARSAGLYAAIEVTHNIRLKSDKESMKADLRCSSNRYREVLDQPGWRNGVKFSPHSHLMAWGFLEEADKFHERTGGWIYKNLGEITNASGLTEYLLSHAPDIEGIHSYRLCGNLKNYCVEGEIKIPVFPKCKECIEGGKPSEHAGMVLAKLASVEYRRDENRHNQLISWEFKENGLSSKPYRTTQIIQVYRRKSEHQLKPGTAADPPPKIPAWISQEEKDWRLREWQLTRKERARERKAAAWVPWSDWDLLTKARDLAVKDGDLKKVHDIDERMACTKWRKYFSQEEYADASVDWQVRMFEWS
jgi:hypothetical protein